MAVRVRYFRIVLSIQLKFVIFYSHFYVGIHIYVVGQTAGMCDKSPCSTYIGVSELWKHLIVHCRSGIGMRLCDIQASQSIWTESYSEQESHFRHFFHSPVSMNTT